MSDAASEDEDEADTAPVHRSHQRAAADSKSSSHAPGVAARGHRLSASNAVNGVNAVNARDAQAAATQSAQSKTSSSRSDRRTASATAPEKRTLRERFGRLTGRKKKGSTASVGPSDGGSDNDDDF